VIAKPLEQAFRWMSAIGAKRTLSWTATN